MTRTAIFTILCAIIAVSCKLTEKDIPGTYRLDRFPKTILKIHPDKTFDFTKNNRNPYLHPFDHPDEYYAETKGHWQMADKKTITLTSQSDTLIYPLVSIRASAARDSKLSHFTFYDTFGDTVKILYVQYPDKMIRAALHRSMNYITEDLSNKDSLEFHFYGYRPYLFIREQKINQDYSITLRPSFAPNFFQGTEFRVKRHRLIDIARKGKFKKL